MTQQAPARPARSAAEQARLESAIRQVFEERIRFNRVLGLQVVSLDPAAPSLRLQMRPELAGHEASGRLHGGVTSAVLDTMGGLAAALSIGHKHADESADQILQRFGRLGTIDLRIDFLRQGLGDWFVAKGTVTRLGGRIASTQMSLENDQGLLIATGAAAYTVS